MSLLNIIKCLFYNAVLLNFPCFIFKVTFCSYVITKTIKKKYGHFQCSAFISFSKLFSFSSIKVALLIKNYILKNQSKIDDTISIVCVTKPGFINLKYSLVHINSFLNSLYADYNIGFRKIITKRKILVDFSSPNIAKEMHVGHLRSTIIGNCLSNGFIMYGYNVLKVNHVGDWGTQFGMLIFYLKSLYPSLYIGDYRCLQNINLSCITKYYKEAYIKFTLCEFFKKKSREEVVLLQKENIVSVTIWKNICDLSMQSFKKIYDILSVNIHTKGESFYLKYVEDVFLLLQKNNALTFSKKAYGVNISLDKKNTIFVILKKTDGGFNYMTTDLAALYYRITKENCDNIYYVTDVGQKLHFEQLFELVQKILPKKKNLVLKLKHVMFGAVLNKTGKRIKTRIDESVTLRKLISTSIKRAGALFLNRYINYNRKQLCNYSKILGVNALKYVDLSSNIINNYKFSYSKMLCFSGNTVVFIMYCYARIVNVKRKSNITVDFLVKNSRIYVVEPVEIELSLHISQFKDKFELFIEKCAPNIITDYLYILAEKFHFFFQSCRILNNENSGSRLLLCELVSLTIAKGFKILGLSIIDKI